MSEKVITAAYNAGVQDGIAQERKRILDELVKNYTNDEDDWAIDWAVEIVEK